MEKPLNVAVCEDTKEDLKKLTEMLKICSVPSEVRTFSSGEEFLSVYKPMMFDLLLSDIYMNTLSGINVVEEIRKTGDDMPVAFITTSTEFALESYRLDVLKYIEKPFKQKEIEDILSLALMKKRSVPSLIITGNGSLERIPLSRISYIEQQGHQLIINFKDGSEDIYYEKLSTVLSQLNPEEFFSPHKSFSVNLSFAKDIDMELRCFVMQNDKIVPIRRESLTKAKKALDDYIFLKARG